MFFPTEYVHPLPSRASRKISLRGRNSVRSISKIQLPNDDFLWRLLGTESKTERNCSALILAMGQVIDIVEQLPPITYFDELGKPHKHTFDFLVTFKSGKKIAVVVKNAKDAQKPDFKRELYHLANQQNIADKLVLFTDKSVPFAQCNNAERLHHLKHLITEDSQRQIGKVVDQMVGGASVLNILARAGYPEGGFATILEFYFERKLTYKSKYIITPRTVMYKRGSLS